MSYINENFLKLQENYLFSTVAKKVAKYSKENPEKDIIKLGIGDVTRPIAPACIEAMNKAIKEIGTQEGFKGYTNNEVCVNLLGGTLHIRIDENTKHIYMKGSAKKVFDGYIDDNYLKEVMYDKD